MTKQIPLSLDFNSPLLQPKIPVTRPGRIRRITIRFIMTLLVFGIISGIVYRWFEPESIGYMLYWLHDEIYLPIKGYTYTWGYPNSLLWWLPILVLSGYWLLTCLTDKPWLRAFHIKAIRFFLYHDVVLHGVLKTWIKWLKSSVFRATLSETVVEHEQKRCLLVVDTAVTPSPNALQRLAIATSFKVDIGLFSPRTTGIEQKLISDLITALIRFYLYKGNALEVPKELWQRLYRITSMKSGLTFDKALTTTDDFSELSLLREILCLFEIRHKRSPYDNVWYDAMDRVLLGIENRGKQLSAERLRLEQLRWGRVQRIVDKQQTDLNTETTTYEGRLAVDVALLFALFSEEPNASLAYIENIEALALTVALADKQSLASIKTLTRLKPYFAQSILTYADYRCCAELIARARKTQYTEIDKRFANGLFKLTDLEFADAHLTTYQY